MQHSFAIYAVRSTYLYWFILKCTKLV